MSVNTVAKIMAEQGLRARPNSGGEHHSAGRGRWRAPDLVGRQFGGAAVNQKWFGDGTEIQTDEGKLYLDSVLDVGSRRVVGFAMDERHDVELRLRGVADGGRGPRRPGGDRQGDFPLRSG